MRCAICLLNEACLGALCATCGERLAGEVAISPEQIAVEGSCTRSGAAFIDEWGRPNHVGHDITIGRTLEGIGFSILHATVSRRHATLSYDPGGWRLRDLGSMNGTWVEETRAHDVVLLVDGCTVRFGPFRFFFVEDASRLPPPSAQRSATKTLTSFPRARTLDLRTGPTSAVATVSFVFQQPTGGGSGVVEIDGTAVHLTLAQFELLSILAERMDEDLESPFDTRGFIDAPALLCRLSLDSSAPGEDSVRQLVRRVRRSLRKVPLHGLIESRPGLGYRLGVVPSIRR